MLNPVTMTDTESFEDAGDVELDVPQQKSTQNTEPGIAKRSRPSRACRQAVKSYDTDEELAFSDDDEFGPPNNNRKTSAGGQKKKQSTQEAALQELLGDDDEDEDFQIESEKDAISDESDDDRMLSQNGGLVEDDIDVAAFEGQGGLLTDENSSSKKKAVSSKKRKSSPTVLKRNKYFSKTSRRNSDDEFIADSDEENEWEDVDDLLTGTSGVATTHKTQPKHAGVEVSIDVGERKSAGTKRKPSRQELVIRQLKKRSREIQTNIHKTHLLCMVAHVRWLFRNVFEQPTLQALILSLIPAKLMQEYKSPPHTAHKTNKLFRELHKLIDYVPTTDESEVYAGISDEMLIRTALIRRRAPTLKHRCLIFGLILRAIGFEVRLVWNMQPFQVQNNFKEAEKAICQAVRGAAGKTKTSSAKKVKESSATKKESSAAKKKSKKGEVENEAAEVAPIRNTRSRRRTAGKNGDVGIKEEEEKPVVEEKATSAAKRGRKTSKVETLPPTAVESTKTTSLKGRTTRSTAATTAKNDDETAPYFEDGKKTNGKTSKSKKTVAAKSEPEPVVQAKTTTAKRTTRAAAGKKNTAEKAVKVEPETEKPASAARGGRKRAVSSTSPAESSRSRNSKRSKRDSSASVADAEEETSANDDSGIKHEDDDGEESKNSSVISSAAADDEDSSGIQSNSSSIAIIGSKKSGKQAKASPANSIVFEGDKLGILSAKLPAKSTGRDFWLEVFCSGSSSTTSHNSRTKSEAEVDNSEYISAGYITFDCLRGHMTRHEEMEREATQPLAYVTSFSFSDLHCSMKDLTSRYAVHWIANNRKLQVDRAWWARTLTLYRPRPTKFERTDETALRMELLQKPLPRTLNEIRAHPLYVVLPNLRKYEAIWPPDTAPSGYVQLNKKNPDDKEALYLRENVVALHARNKWLQQALTIKQGEQPYKVVKKWVRKKKRMRMGHDINTMLMNRLAGLDNNDEKLELFGEWQTEPYIPPAAEHGQVPRNEYGNVELFKACMMPGGCCMVRIPGGSNEDNNNYIISRVARKAGIDVARAMIGWDSHKGHSHPMFDGYIVCKENHDKLIQAYKEYVAEKQEKQQQNEEEQEEESPKKKGKKTTKKDEKPSTSSGKKTAGIKKKQPGGGWGKKKTAAGAKKKKD